MAKITDYASLAAAVIDHTNREDLAGPMPRFVQMAEQGMKRRLRTLDMEKTEELVAANGTLPLPSDILTIRSLSEGSGDASLPDGSYRITGTELLLDPQPADGAAFALTYVAAFAPLEAGTSNWLIEQHPDVYFYGTLSQAYAHYRDTDGLMIAESAFRNALEEIAKSRNADRFGGVLAPSTVQQVRGARC